MKKQTRVKKQADVHKARSWVKAAYWQALLSFALVPMPSIFGQASQPSPSPAPGGTVKSEEVSLDLVVRDKKNRPILDLKPEELAIMDNGSPVKLTSLRFANGESGKDHEIVLVFDHLNPAIKKKAIELAARILKAVPQDKFPLAVLKVQSGRLALLQGFTFDKKAIGEAIDAALEPEKSEAAVSLEKSAEDRVIGVATTGADPSGGHVSATDSLRAKVLLAAMQDSSRIMQEQHAQPYMAELLVLAQAQQQLPGRKIFIDFTQGVYTDSHGREMLRSIINAANRAGVTIYTVDMAAFGSVDPSAGMYASMKYISSKNEVYPPGLSSSEIRGAAYPDLNQTQRRLVLGVAQSDYHDMSAGEQLAKGTGGIYMDGARNLQKHLQQMMQDLTTYYEVSYLPALHEYDGKFHSIAVKPLRKGVKVQSMEGYYALPPDLTSGTQPFEVPLLNVLNADHLPADLVFHGAVLRLGELPSKDSNTLAIEAPLSDVEARQDVNTKLYSVQLAVVARIKDRAGTVIEKFSEDIPYRGALEDIENTGSQVITVQRHFNASPGEYVLEAAILDRLSGKTGAQRIAFEIPQRPEAAWLSDMVLVRRTEPFDSERDPLEPLGYGTEKITPNLSGELAPNTKNTSVFFITHTDPHSSEAATLEIQIFKDGKILAGLPKAEQIIRGEGTVSHLATFPVSTLPKGMYEIRVTLSQSGKTSSAAASFNVPGSLSTREETEVGNDTAVPAEIEPLSSLAIKFDTRAAQPPPPGQIKSVLAEASTRAIEYGFSLPNFICTQITNRLVDPTGNGRWKYQDTITERLTYVDNVEKRTTLARSGGAKALSDDLLGAFSKGEFGSVLTAMFQPSSKADFQWKESASLGNGTIQIFDYRVLRENSTFLLTFDVSRSLIAAFHGQVFIDDATHRVRRVTMVADDLPKTFFIQAASVSVDYDYVAINGHDFLLPVSAQIGLRQRDRNAMLNEIQFRDYRHFASTAKISPAYEEKH